MSTDVSLLPLVPKTESQKSQKSSACDDDDLDIWGKIDDDFCEQREEVESFKRSQNTTCQAPYSPTVQYIEDEIFVILVDIMEKTINKAIETSSLKYEKSPFNGVDYIAELLWNLNPRYPERKDNWTYLFDMDWVIKSLEEKPRPYFPFSWIWSKEYAATKIQAYMRGHWVRRRTEVQEMRQFWKVLKKEDDGDSISRLPSVLWPYLPFYDRPDKQVSVLKTE